MKKYALLMLGCALAAALVIAWGVGEPPPHDGAPEQRVALVLSEDTGTYMMKLKSGAQDAAIDLSAELSIFVARDALPAQVTGGEYTAVILAGAGGVQPAEARQVLENTPLVCVDNEGGNYAVLTDPGADGQAAALALDISDGMRVVLLFDEAESARLDGARTALAGHECYPVAYSPDNAICAQITALRPDAIVALSEEATLFAVEAKRAGILDATLPLSGFLPGDAVAELLESGLLNAATAPVPYAIGYQAVSAVFVKQSVAVPGRTITPEILFDAENAAVVFPLLQ